MALVIRIQRQPTTTRLPAAMRVSADDSSRGVAAHQQQQQPPLTPAEGEAVATLQPSVDFERARQIILRARAAEGKRSSPHGDAPLNVVARVFQLDGEEIDAALIKTLYEKLSGAADLVHPTIPYRWAEELQLAFALIIYRFSVWDRSQSFGDKHVNLVYRDESAAAALGRSNILVASVSTVPSWQRKTLHIILSLLVPYMLRKAEHWVVTEREPLSTSEPSGWRHVAEWGRRIATLAGHVSTLVAAMDLLNFTAFLMYGRYRSLPDRLAQMRLVHGRQRMERHVSLYYLNQSVFWQVLLSFSSVVLPLLNLGRLWTSLTQLRQYATGARSVASVLHTCVFCGAAEDTVTMPRRLVACGHTACYYCIASRLRSASSDAFRAALQCPTCGGEIHDHTALL